MRIRSRRDSVGTDFSVRWSRTFLHASMPSLVGIFVYKEDTSRVTRIALEGIFKLVEQMSGVLYVGR